MVELNAQGNWIDCYFQALDINYSLKDAARHSLKEARGAFSSGINNAERTS